jgi:hypothetical protein
MIRFMLRSAMVFTVLASAGAGDAVAQDAQGSRDWASAKVLASRLLSSPVARYRSSSGIMALRRLTMPFQPMLNRATDCQLRPFEQPDYRIPSSGQVMVNDPATDKLTIFDLTSQSETAVASFGHSIVVAYNDDGSYLNLSDSGYSRSTDGGSTFLDLGEMPVPPTASFTAGDPALVVDRHGTFYYAEIMADPTRPPGYEFTLGISRSVDGGQHFGSTVYPPAAGVLPDSFQDKEFLAVDTSDSPFAGNIYLSWTSEPVTGEWPIMFSRSIDGGATFSTPIPISVPGDFNQFSEPAVGPMGEVYVAWFRFASFFPTLDLDTILVAKSVDGGAHFGAPVTVTSVPEIGFFGGTLFGNLRVNSAPRIDVDPTSGTVCIVFNANPPGLDGADVFFTRSLDGGNHWTTPIRVNDDTGFNDQFFPDLAINQDGIIEVIWYDRRLDPSNLKMDVYRARSVNGGQSFRPNQRVTSVSSFPAVGYDPALIGNYLGDYIDIKPTMTGAGRGKDFLLAWADFRRIISTPRGNRPDQDVFFMLLSP